MNLKKLVSTLFFCTIICTILIGCNKDNINNDCFTNIQSIVSNNNQNLFVSEDEDFIYVTDTFTVKKISKKDNSVMDIFRQDIPEAGPIIAFEYFDDRIYILLYNKIFMSMDTNGDNVCAFDFGAVYDGNSTSINAYIFDKTLYFIVSTTEIYRVISEPLSLERCNEDILNHFITKDNIHLYKRSDNGNGKIYIIETNGEEILLSEPEERVLTYNVNFTDFYVYYPSYNSDFTLVNIYRVALDGSEKTLVKTIPRDDLPYIQYDNYYIYIKYAEKYVKIDKLTLEETDIPNTSNLINGLLEPVDKKIFSCLGGNAYYIDSISGEVVYLNS